MNELGERLRELRVAKGISQRDLAGRVGVSFPHISKVEAGRERPSDELLNLVAPHLGVGADELLILAKRLPAESAEDLLSIVSDPGQRGTATLLLRKWASGELSEKDSKALKKIAESES